MGIVYDARDPKIGRRVALKTIRWQDLGDDNERTWLRDRLFREARSAGNLNHPGIVVIYDVGEDSERAFIAMERVEGPTLQAILASGPVSDCAALLGILEQCAEALDFAHENGIVHRDIKPSNIMLHRNSRVKIADFGIAKVLATQHHTKTGMVMGTPSYMSPEQIKAQTIDGRSDQFSLAVIAFEMLAGQKPFNGDSLAALVHQIVYEEPRSLLETAPHLPREVDTVIRKALSKNAADRYAASTQFVRALRAAMQTTAEKAVKLHPKASANRGWVAVLIVSSGLCFGVGYLVGRGVAPAAISPLKAHAPAEVSKSQPQATQGTAKKTDAAPPPVTTVPIDLEEHFRKAAQFENLGKYDDAIAEYDAVLKAEAGNARAAAGRARDVKAKETERVVLGK